MNGAQNAAVLYPRGDPISGGALCRTALHPPGRQPYRSERHLSDRIFKLSIGKTLSEYLNEYRTAQSLPMLSDTSDTINRISENAGYNDVRSYIRFFKKFYGMTPGEYRRGAGSDS